MTRTSRTILVMGLMAVSGVVALAWMAQRYGDALSRRAPAAAGPGGASASARALPAADAERLVAAYVNVSRAVERARQAAPVREREEASRLALSRALALHDLAPEQYQELESLERAWRAGGAAIPPAYRAALERNRSRLPEATTDQPR